MKLFIRICSIIVAAALILTLFYILIYTSAAQAETVYLTASSETVTAGDQASVDFTLTNSGVYGVQFIILYDNTVLSVASVTVPSAVLATHRCVVNPTYTDESFSVMIYGDCAIPTGVIATAVFDTDSGADTTASVEFAGWLLSDSNAADITSASAVDGSVTIEPAVTEPAVALATYAKNLKLGSDVTLNVYVDPAYVDTYGYSNLYTVFSLSDRNRTVYPDAARVNGYLQFSFKNINPYELAQDISITVYGTFDGRLYSSATQTYSVVTYCANTFKKPTVSTAMKTMIADMLNYGAAVQIYTNKYTDNLCNEVASVADYVDTYETKSEPALSTISNKSYKTVASPTATWLGGNLMLGSAVSIQYAFTTTENIADLEVRIYDGSTLQQTFSGDDIVYDGESGFYYVKFSKYGAGYMSRPADAEIYKNGVKISNTFRYSIESYAYARVNGSGAQVLKNVCAAMMKYGNSAAALL